MLKRCRIVYPQQSAKQQPTQPDSGRVVFSQWNTAIVTERGVPTISADVPTDRFVKVDELAATRPDRHQAEPVTERPRLCWSLHADRMF